MATKNKVQDVMLHEDNKYVYEKKLKDWRKFATRNKVPFHCEKCHETNAHKTVYLDTGVHICWYCWIRNDHKFDNVVHKPKHIVKEDLPKTNKKVKTKDVNKEIEHTKVKNVKKENVHIEVGQVEPKKQESTLAAVAQQALIVKTTRKAIENTLNVQPKAIVESTSIITQPTTKKEEIIDSTNPTIKKTIQTLKVSETSKVKKVNFGSNECVLHSKEIKDINSPIETKYARLEDQNQSDKVSLFKETKHIHRGIPSIDPVAKYAIEMINIHKSFLNGKVIANDGVYLRVKKNEVHAIIGENGAGKSTLMSILFGLYSPDKGTIRVNNRRIYFCSAKDATRAGLGMVQQHFQLVPSYTVLQNVVLGSELVSKRFKHIGLLDMKDARKKIQDLVYKYNLSLNLDTKVSKLTVGQQQKTEILKLLYRNADILIFDEPTAVLSPDEITQFMKMVADLKAEGKTIIIITHKFNEIKTIADHATVIRHGVFISDFDVKNKSIQDMATEMVGHELSEVSNNNHKYNDEIVLDIQDLVLKMKNNSKKETTPINLQIHSGEIYAIAGVEGNGQSELVRAISGLDRRSQGKIIINGVNVNNLPINKRNKIGLSHIPENRQRHGLILDLPIYMNAIINEIGKRPFSKLGFINEKAIREYTRLLLKKFNVRGSVRGTSDARGLSGGNQQKLIVARELSHGHKLIIMMQPTRGLDLGAVKYIHKKILEEKNKGNAILLVSYELDEILSLADRIAVMSNGSISVVGNTTEMTRNRIGQIMAGKK